MVLDAGQAEHDLTRGALGCPSCGGRLRPWLWATWRRIRLRDGTRLVRPRRARCASCRTTHVLCCPPDACPGADEVIGMPLLRRDSRHGW
jgi:hypothetical protein